MIFAAGKGTRLKPLTDNIPKALIKVKGMPLLEHVIKHLKQFGVNEIIINVHYLAEQIKYFLKTKNYFNVQFHISDESDLLLDTGGGLKNAATFFNTHENFIVYNVDVLSDIDLNEMMNEHIKNGNLATLAVRNRHSNRYLLFDDELQLCGWENTKTSQKIISRMGYNMLKPFAFSGIHLINSDIFGLITEEGVFSMTEVYIRLAKNYKIKAYLHQNSQWYDIGKHDTLIEADKYYKISY